MRLIVLILNPDPLRSLVLSLGPQYPIFFLFLFSLFLIFFKNKVSYANTRMHTYIVMDDDEWMISYRTTQHHDTASATSIFW